MPLPAIYGILLSSNASKLYEDYTGVDSMSAFFCSVIVFVTVQFLEYKMQRPLFRFPGDAPYDKMETEEVSPTAEFEVGVEGSVKVDDEVDYEKEVEAY